MLKETKGGLLGSCLTEEQEEKVLLRCFDFVDFVSDTTMNIIIDFIQNIPSPEAKQFLLSRPEEITIRAFDKVLSDLFRRNRKPEGQTH